MQITAEYLDRTLMSYEPEADDYWWYSDGRTSFEVRLDEEGQAWVIVNGSQWPLPLWDTEQLRALWRACFSVGLEVGDG